MLLLLFYYVLTIHSLLSMINQVLFHSGKSRKLQQLPRYLTGTVTSTLKAGTGGCGGRSGHGG